MSHKDEPPQTEQQKEFERVWCSLMRPGETIGFGRGRDGQYLAEAAQMGWRLWQTARALGRNEREREMLAMQNRRGSG